MDAELERTIRSHCEAGDIEAALKAALDGYGREVLGFLYVRTGDETAAGDVFSLLSEDIWKGLSGFTWRSSFRTWMYVLARNAAFRYSQKKPKNETGLSRASQIALDVRTRTAHYLRTQGKQLLEQLSGDFKPEDQQIIVLRSKRGLSWEEVAAVMLGEGDLDDAEVKRAAARYRQRYKTLKERLRARAREAGLLAE